MPGQDIATAAGSQALAIAADQTGWTDRQLVVLRHIGTEKATAADLELFFHVCARTGLDPFARQIYLAEYGGKPTIQTGIDGYRLIARRAADKAGHEYELEPTEWCGQDGVWRDVWLDPDNPPAAARTAVIRNGKRFPKTVLYSEYAGTKNLYENGRKVGTEINQMWRTKPASQLEKCAEAGALRKAFPHDLAGVYIAEEMQRENTIQGEMVREDIPAAAGPAVGPILELVAAATTEDELRAIWAEHIPTIRALDDRAQVTAAIHAARERVAAAAAQQVAAEDAVLADSQDAP